jgi:alpha-amylase
MAPADLSSIVSLVREAVEPESAPYLFLEVIDHGGEAVSATDYLEIGTASATEIDITEFKYTGVGHKFLNTDGQNVAELSDLLSGGWGLLATDRAVVFTNNHDTQRADSISYQDAAHYELATIFMLAMPYGYPKLMSSYAFVQPTDHALGPPSDTAGNTTSVYAPGSDSPQCAQSPEVAVVGDWVCEHRVHSATSMVAFRKVTHGAPLSNVWTNGGNQIAFGRTAKGYVAINREATALDQTLQSDLPPGTYCDVISGALEGAACTGASVVVAENGMLPVALAANQALALHVEAKLP